jgi:hypothetical protein
VVLALGGVVVTAAPVRAADPCVPTGNQVVCTYLPQTGAQPFTVPARVFSAAVSLTGGSGGKGYDGGDGGPDGTTTATLNLTPGNILDIYAGGEGARGHGSGTVPP